MNNAWFPSSFASSYLTFLHHVTNLLIDLICSQLSSIEETKSRIKPPLHVETFSWNLCATALRNKSQQALHRNLFRNVEIFLVSKLIIADLFPVSDWLTQSSVTRPSETSFTKWCYTVKLWFFSPLRPLRAVAEVESGSTFRETCLATEVQKVSRNRPCYTVQRLLKLVSQCRWTQVSAKSFNV